MNRRQLFATLGAVALAPGELWTPSRKIFLPPRGGWSAERCQDWLNYEIERELQRLGIATQSATPARVVRVSMPRAFREITFNVSVTG